MDRSMEMRKIKDLYVQYFFEECGAYGLDWEGYEILDKNNKVVGCIPVGRIGSPDDFEKMDDQILEQLVDSYMNYYKMIQSSDSMDGDDLPF